MSVGDIIAHAGRHGFRKTRVSNKTCDMTFLLYRAMLRCEIKIYIFTRESRRHVVPPFLLSVWFKRKDFHRKKQIRSLFIISAIQWFKLRSLLQLSWHYLS